MKILYKIDRRVYISLWSTKGEYYIHPIDECKIYYQPAHRSVLIGFYRHHGLLFGVINNSLKGFLLFNFVLAFGTIAEKAEPL
jgi:hypothetical protein